MFFQTLRIPSPLANSRRIEPRKTYNPNSVVREGWLRELIEEYVSLFEPPNSELFSLLRVNDAIPHVSILQGPSDQTVVLLGETHRFECERQAWLQTVLLKSIPATAILLEGPGFKVAKQESVDHAADPLEVGVGEHSELVKISSNCLAAVNLAYLYLISTDYDTTPRNIISCVGSAGLSTLVNFIAEQIVGEENSEERLKAWLEFFSGLIEKQFSYENSIRLYQKSGGVSLFKLRQELVNKVTEKVELVEDLVLDLQSTYEIPPEKTYTDIALLLLNASLALRKRQSGLILLPTYDVSHTGDFRFLEEPFLYDDELKKTWESGAITLDYYLRILDREENSTSLILKPILRLRKTHLRSRLRRWLSCRDSVMASTIHQVMSLYCSKNRYKRNSTDHIYPTYMYPTGVVLVGFAHVIGIERQLQGSGWRVIAQFSRTPESTITTINEALFAQFEASCFNHARLIGCVKKWLDEWVQY
ncbi:MAG: hypothetical protein QXL01_04505 [Thermoplasmatales archaeon]